MRRLKRWVVITTLVLGTGAVFGACAGDDSVRTPTDGAELASRTVEAGEVTVEVTPGQIDAGGAAFEVVLDTHAVELDLDVADSARLVVDGNAWKDATWDGAAPGGHHREGVLRFAAGGEATGTAELTIDGLPEPVVATWRVGDR